MKKKNFQTIASNLTAYVMTSWVDIKIINRISSFFNQLNWGKNMNERKLGKLETGEMIELSVYLWDEWNRMIDSPPLISITYYSFFVDHWERKERSPNFDIFSWIFLRYFKVFFTLFCTKQWREMPIVKVIESESFLFLFKSFIFSLPLPSLLVNNNIEIDSCHRFFFLLPWMISTGLSKMIPPLPLSFPHLPSISSQFSSFCSVERNFSTLKNFYHCKNHKSEQLFAKWWGGYVGAIKSKKKFFFLKIH